MTYGLQMSSIPSVDSAVGGLDHVGSSTFEYFNHSTSCPLDGTCALLVLEELDSFFHFEGMQIFGSDGLCQTVLFVSLAVQPVFVRSDVY